MLQYFVGQVHHLNPCMKVKLTRHGLRATCARITANFQSSLSNYIADTVQINSDDSQIVIKVHINICNTSHVGRTFWIVFLLKLPICYFGDSVPLKLATRCNLLRKKWRQSTRVHDVVIFGTKKEDIMQVNTIHQTATTVNRIYVFIYH